ncbi:MAG: MazG family protein [Candidatus Nanopelagicaceae bacterium]|nr:MazG family protein [Candidatus Nanopelagicaceae bacterium]
MTSTHLQQLVAVMDRLRSPGGCPWDAEQTHESLIKYLLEESYEFIEAVETGDREAMREELGDVLLQVYFHARMAQEHPTDPFSIEDVAQTVAEKLIRRHPHVFGDVEDLSSDQVLENWEAIKAAEKGRTSAVEGVPLAQPALPLVSKLLYRAEKNRLTLDLPSVIAQPSEATEAAVGDVLLATIAWASANNVDPEGALRLAARRLIAQIEELESTIG